MTATPKLFAVYLGGRAPRCNTELHDVVFVTGATIEDTYRQLLDAWFGSPEGLHIDSWMELDIVDGHRVELSLAPAVNNKKIFFVNLGAYKDGEFTEMHANSFVVAGTDLDAKKRAKEDFLKKETIKPHTDSLFEVDSCIELGTVNDFCIALTPTDAISYLEPHNAYHILPKDLIEDYLREMESMPLEGTGT
jgi:hypothetical protein